MYLDIREDELQQKYEEILTIMGAFDVDVDLEKEEVLIMLRHGLNEFEKETSIWQIKNQFSNVYGLPAGLIMSNQLATMNFSIANQITDWFSSMARVGGKIPWHKDYIILEPGRQIYDLSKESSKPYPPGTRRIHRVMWVARPEVLNFTRFSNSNPHGDDVLYSSNWNFTTNGLNYGTSPLAFLGYTFDTIMLMQSAEARQKILFSEFFHNLSGDMLEITPMPGAQLNAVTTGMKLFYYYFDESEVALNAKNNNLYQSSEASSTLSASEGLAPGEGNLIANPLNMKIDYVTWSGLSPWAKTFVFDYALAKCKYIQGSKWRKIQKTISGGEMDYQIEFDYQSLLNESQDEIIRLKEDIRQALDEISVVKMLQNKEDMANSARNINKNVPRKWFIS